MVKQIRDPESASETPGEPNSLFDTVATYLDINDWHYEANPERGWFSMSYIGDDGTWRVVVDTTELEKVRRVLVYSIYPVRVPAARRLQAAEFIARINHGMTLGNFELDVDDGEIRVKTVTDVGEGEMGDEVLDRLLLVNVHTANRYLAAMLSVAFGSTSAQAAAELVEAAIAAKESTVQ
jgi:hypothetical protein